MDKQEFLRWVAMQAGWVGLDWERTGSPKVSDIRKHDPALADLMDRQHAASDAIFAYCKGRLEGK